MNMEDRFASFAGDRLGQWAMVPASDENNGLVCPSRETSPWWTMHVICNDTETQNLIYQVAAAAPEMLRMLQVINRIASPNPERTFDGIIRDLDMITDFARSGIAKALNPQSPAEGGPSKPQEPQP